MVHEVDDIVGGLLIGYINYPCTDSAETNFDEWEPGAGVIDINFWSSVSASSLKLTELVWKLFEDEDK